MGSDALSLAVAVPIWQSKLSDLAKKRLIFSLSQVEQECVFFFGPSKLDRSWYREIWPNAQHLLLPSHHFESRKHYSRFMLSPVLYRALEDFEFTLILQDDALLLRQPVGKWDFDYCGAVWDPPIVRGKALFREVLVSHPLRVSPRILKVGNGGLSLRRNRSMISFTEEMKGCVQKENEDVVISFFARDFGLKLADEETADTFFQETRAKFWRPGRPIPPVFGFHALGRFNPSLEQIILALAK